METKIDKSKVMVIGHGKADIYINGVQLKEVNSFVYFEATLSKDSSSMTDIYIRITTELQQQWQGWTGLVTATSDLL